MCGGTATDAYLQDFDNGLSPRVRGNLGAYSRHRPPQGSIPACAGEPGCWPSRTSCLAVYPRVCGGTRLSEVDPPGVIGLSPRVRGNRVGGRGAGQNAGSIPACAGEPSACTSVQTPKGVYPRVCGGTGPDGLPSALRPGLSPRVRGNPARPPRSPGRRRSIPACAGEPPNGCQGMHLEGVYPRVCGGTSLARTPWPGPGGLSPRVRGNPSEAGSRQTTAGSIPACAGEPRPALTLAAGHRVYPRVCGGTAPRGVRRAVEVWASALGLSPRVRGNRSMRTGREV